MKDLIKDAKGKLTKLQEGGATGVDISDVIAVLDQLRDHQTLHPMNIANTTEMFKATIASADQAIKAALLISSGSTAALLALLGHLVTAQTRNTSRPLFEAITNGLFCFGAAFLMVVLAAGLRYVSQSFFANDLMHQLKGAITPADRSRGMATRFKTLCLVSLVSAVPLIVAGGWNVYEGLRAQAKEEFRNLGAASTTAPPRVVGH